MFEESKPMDEAFLSAALDWALVATCLAAFWLLIELAIWERQAPGASVPPITKR
jgi:hypothetical protein